MEWRLHSILRPHLLEWLLLHSILWAHLLKLLLHSILRGHRLERLLLHSVLWWTHLLKLWLHSILWRHLLEWLLLHSILWTHLLKLLLLHSILWSHLVKWRLHSILRSHARHWLHPIHRWPHIRHLIELLLHSILRAHVCHLLEWLLLHSILRHHGGVRLLLVRVYRHWLAELVLIRRRHLIGWVGPRTVLNCGLCHNLLNVRSLLLTELAEVWLEGAAILVLWQLLLITWQRARHEIWTWSP
jgi:hypothetical protein